MSLKTNVGAPDSNSFITLAEADDLLEDFGVDSTSWEELSDTEKAFRLTMAAEAIGASFPLRGYKAYINQALSFPRALVRKSYTRQSYRGTRNATLVSRSTNTIYPLGCDSFEEIPADIKKAQAYIAYHVIHKNMVSSNSISESELQVPSTMTISSFSVRGISVSYRDTTGESYLQAMDQIIADAHSPLYLLMSKYISQVRFTQGDDMPEQLTYNEEDHPPQPDDDILDGGSFNT